MVFGFRAEPSAAHQMQFVEDKPFRSPRDDLLVNVVGRFPRVLRWLIKAKGAVIVHVNAVRWDDLRILDPHLRHAVLSVGNRDSVCSAILRRRDYAIASQVAMRERALKTWKVFLD